MFHSPVSVKSILGLTDDFVGVPDWPLGMTFISAAEVGLALPNSYC